MRYRQGRGPSYYIPNAGGYARNADKGKVSVRYANGSAPGPGPGSIVRVPQVAEGPPFNLTEFLGSMAQILESTVAILVMARKL